MALDPGSLAMLKEGAARLGVDLLPLQVAQFETYAGLLQLWGRKINLTRRITAEEIVVYHFLDSLAGLPVVGRGKTRIADIGSGAGFPGLPLKIASPRLTACLVESSHKKLSFCREVVGRAGLEKVFFAGERAETAGRKEKYRSSFDWVVTRAFTDSADTLRLALPFLSAEGSLLLYKGSPGAAEIEALEKEAALHRRTVRSLPAAVPFLDASRTLLVVSPPG